MEQVAQSCRPISVLGGFPDLTVQCTGLIWCFRLRPSLVSQLTLLHQEVQLEASWDPFLLRYPTILCEPGQSQVGVRFHGRSMAKIILKTIQKYFFFIYLPRFCP